MHKFYWNNHKLDSGEERDMNSRSLLKLRKKNCRTETSRPKSVPDASFLHPVLLSENRHSKVIRSKSCDRVKKKDTFSLQNNLHRLSSNVCGKLSGLLNGISDESEIENTITTNGTDEAQESLSSSQRLETRSSLTHRMKGLRNDVHKKFSRFRSRSAERIPHKYRNSSPESSHKFPSPISSPRLPTYSGPFIGLGRALVDCTPSPYDSTALRFRKGDVVEIISMNPNGFWKGHVNGRIGTFKFINVQVLNSKGRVDRTTLSILPFRNTDNSPKSVEEFLKHIGFPEYISVFVLNGYETLEAFSEIDSTELDYLGIFNENHRTALLNALEYFKHDVVPSSILRESSQKAVEQIRDSGIYQDNDSDSSASSVKVPSSESSDSSFNRLIEKYCVKASSSSFDLETKFKVAKSVFEKVQRPL